mgnify:CR=1 FL=1
MLWGEIAIELIIRVIRTKLWVVHIGHVLWSLPSKGYRAGVDFYVKGCYTLSINNKEKDLIMYTFEKKLKKLQELAPEYAANLLEEDQKDAFEYEAYKWGYTVEELVYPYVETVTFTDLDAQTNFNNQLITMYQ